MNRIKEIFDLQIFQTGVTVDDPQGENGQSLESTYRSIFLDCPLSRIVHFWSDPDRPFSDFELTQFDPSLSPWTADHQLDQRFLMEIRFQFLSEVTCSKFFSTKLPATFPENK